MLPWTRSLSVLALLGSAACGSDDESASGTGGAAGSGASSSGGTSATGGTGGAADASTDDANSHDASTDDVGSAGQSGGCSVLFQQAGLVHESTLALPKRVIPIPDAGPASYRKVELDLDVSIAGWTPKQGQYEVFTLLRGNKWVGNAIGYVAVGGPLAPKTVMVANLGLPGAAAPDGRRITKNYAYSVPGDYHFHYLYDVDLDIRQVTMGGAVVTQVTGKVSAPPATPPITSIDVPSSGMTFLLGGEELAEGPDAFTESWKFQNAKVVGCP
jgi:hypothetical protein